MIDAAAIVTKTLRADSTLMAAVGNRVYADILPEAVTAPFVLVTVNSVTPAAPPTIAWDTVQIQVQIVGADNTESTLITTASRVRALIHGMDGSKPTGAAIQGVDIQAMNFGYADIDSPALPRWVLTVNLTARSA